MQESIFTSTPLPQIKLDSFLSLPVLFGLLVIFFIIYAIFTSILVYHWRTYGMKSKKVIAVEGVFFIVSIALFAIAGVSLFYL